jgi:hypothetical protein
MEFLKFHPGPPCPTLSCPAAVFYPLGHSMPYAPDDRISITWQMPRRGRPYVKNFEVEILIKSTTDYAKRLDAFQVGSRIKSMISSTRNMIFIENRPVWGIRGPWPSQS